MAEKRPIRTNLTARLYGIWAMMAFAGVTIPALVLLALVPGENARRSLVRNAARIWLWLAGARLQVFGLEHLPAGPCVVVANHASYLDGIILTAALPPRFAFVIKKEMTKVPFANFLLTRIGSIFVDRTSQQRAASDARRILTLAMYQKSIAFFPEGTFIAEPGLRRFRDGAFVAALRGRLPVAPVAITGSRQMMPAFTWLPSPSRISVTIRPPVDIDSGRMPLKELKRICRESILDSLPEPDAEPARLEGAAEE